MPVEVTLNTPLADALTSALQPKLSELGWATGGADDSALAEYIVLMLVNQKSPDEIAAELSADLLNLGPDDQNAKDFARWLFEQIDLLGAQYNGAGAGASADSSMAEPQQSENNSGAANPATQADGDTEMNAAPGAPELNAPTGPKSMRNGNVRPAGKRILGQINRTLDRTNDNVLHRVRGQSGSERIARTPPTGPRMGAGRQPRVNNARTSNVARGMAAGANGPFGLPGQPDMSGAWSLNGGQPQPMDIMAMLEQQQRMIQQMMMFGGQQPGPSPGHGNPLFERAQRPPQHHHNNSNFRRGGGPRQHDGHGHRPAQTAEAQAAGGVQDESQDVEMSGAKREPANPEQTVCKYNLSCTNKDCKFAHQSPAAPPGTTIDMNDVCSFGAACKNRKCVGRHPSPANKIVHQSEQDCKFFPNCQNPRCPFRHPTMPPCRNGGECKVPNCKFTHVKTPCKFRPCTNRYCPFTHEEGQRGTFHDKVWVADGSKEHVSERKFVDEKAPEDVVIPGGADNEHNTIQEVIG